MWVFLASQCFSFVPLPLGKGHTSHLWKDTMIVSDTCVSESIHIRKGHKSFCVLFLHKRALILYRKDECNCHYICISHFFTFQRIRWSIFQLLFRCFFSWSQPSCFFTLSRKFQIDKHRKHGSSRGIYHPQWNRKTIRNRNSLSMMVVVGDFSERCGGFGF